MKIGIVGGGAAGAMAAIFAARGGASVTLIEKNEKIGKKLYITGKGRCNVTNDCDVDEFLQAVVHGEKFLRSAIHTFTSEDTMEFFEALGLSLVTERGNRVFPASGKSSDVIKALSDEMKRQGVEVRLNCETKEITATESGFDIKSDKEKLHFDKVIIATGGITYPSTGSTGDGYRFAKKCGHSVVAPVCALAPMLTVEDVKDLEGLSLKNVELTAFSHGKKIASDFGEMLFTSNGISGPIVLTLSSLVNRMERVHLALDLKPALNYETLDARLLREFDAAKNQEIKSVMRSLLPERLIAFVLQSARIDSAKRVNSLTKEERVSIEKALKELPFSLRKIGGAETAVITSGGVNVNEINPSTMESKLVKGLYFAGEVMDLDAKTGGYNLQIAFATGYAAATHAVKQ